MLMSKPLLLIIVSSILSHNMGLHLNENIKNSESILQSWLTNCLPWNKYAVM